MNDTIVKPYISMPDNIALEFIRYMIKPDNPPLGIPFAWLQPDNNDTIMLSSIYVGMNKEISLYDLFYLDNYPLDIKKDIIRTFQNNPGKKVNPDDTLQLSGIVECPEISIPYNDLERDEMLLYHLAVMSINTMTEAHNWACSYLEFLAYNHYSFKNHAEDWKVYELSFNNIDNDLIDSMFEYSSALADYLDLYGYTIDYNQNDECYYYFNEWKDMNLEIQELIKANDDFMNEWNIRDYDHEIISTLAFMVDWIKTEWNEGYLTFQLNDNMPKSLYEWYASYVNQYRLWDN